MTTEAATMQGTTTQAATTQDTITEAATTQDTTTETATTQETTTKAATTQDTTTKAATYPVTDTTNSESTTSDTTTQVATMTERVNTTTQMTVQGTITTQGTSTTQVQVSIWFMSNGNSSFFLTCTSTGGLAKSVIWTRDGFLLHNTGPLVPIDNSTLSYTNVLTVSDQDRIPGTYTCTIRDPSDQSLSSASFRVQGT